MKRTHASSISRYMDRLMASLCRTKLPEQPLSNGDVKLKLVSKSLGVQSWYKLEDLMYLI